MEPYILGQYYRWQVGHSVELELQGLLKFYGEVERANHGTVQRLKAERREDGTANAFVLLDMFAKTLQFSVKDTPEELAPLFQSYIIPNRRSQACPFRAQVASIRPPLSPGQG